MRIETSRLSRAAALLLASVMAVGTLSGCGSIGRHPPAPKSAETPDHRYKIGPLDTLNIVVWRNPELSMSVPIRPDGKITTPLVEDLVAQGKQFDIVLAMEIIEHVADVDAFIEACGKLLKPGGVLVDVGLPEHASTLRLSSLTNGNKVLAGSQIGGIAETQEVLDFCAANGVVPQVEIITGEDITAAYDKVVHSQVRYRYVIDTSTF